MLQLQGLLSNFQGTSDDAGRLSFIHRAQLASNLTQMQADMHFDVSSRSKARNRILPISILPLLSQVGLAFCIQLTNIEPPK